MEAAKEAADQTAPEGVPVEVLQRFTEPDIPPVHEQMADSPIKVFWKNLERLQPAKPVKENKPNDQLQNEDENKEGSENNKDNSQDQSNANNENADNEPEVNEVRSRDIELEDENNTGDSTNTPIVSLNSTAADRELLEEIKAEKRRIKAEINEQNQEKLNSFYNKFWGIFSVVAFFGVIIFCKDEKK
ncbi:hypothetical protein TVAG_369980 [Trichomonas vaginalis G3]|uniref:Uncharacterized protein n=1 Tax=Trichomonas vaginalis (strain ATCC PRA-98 / G3) TaxID=412133 RepID=A2EX50_TRIV3|nr:hypothetical protein TVAGG3_0860060 [Trichomonas vaginalis G3]EAY02770.1 hypothetical protein TVAG_369980 [Trichomonas vaginalis G3]KAI5500604.1 hypothetical protein TVAGG3_0860060 [Trichomonas vaginalis G3]|eukprot:XP_001314993.1 hypothetical protein [Trichomonas vaginalis G3]